jgi:hypothetical protein
VYYIDIILVLVAGYFFGIKSKMGFPTIGIRTKANKESHTFG